MVRRKEISLVAPRRAPVIASLVFLALVAVPVTGNGGRVVFPLSFDPRSATPPDDPRTLDTTRAAVRGVAAIITRTFRLTMPERVMVYVYAGRREFEQGLIHDARVSPGVAARLSDFAIGVGAQGQVLLNEDIRDRSGRERLRLIAHELTHVSQIELAGGEGRGEQWLAEGMAEWVAFSTLEHLGLDSLGWRRLAAASGVRDHPSLLEDGLHLEAHGTPRGFTGWHQREGAVPTYQLAFLMADLLIAEHGLDPMKAYFASFSRSADRRANFRRAFGADIGAFETTMLAHLGAPTARSPIEPAAP